MASAPPAAMVSHDAESEQLRAALLAAETRVRQLEQRLRHSEDALGSVTAALPLGLARIDRGLRYRHVNAAHARGLLGTESGSLNGRLVAEVIGDAAFAIIEPRLAQALAGWAVDFEAQLPLPAGAREVRVSLVPERDAGGAVAGLLAVVQDITERREAQARLYQREREFETLAENAPDAIVRVDRQQHYVYLNRAAETAFGVRLRPGERRDAIGLGFPADYADPTGWAIGCAIRDGHEQAMRFFIGSGAERRDFVARAVPEFDREGAVESVLLIVYDDSERVLAQAAHERLLDSEHAARRLAEVATRSRDEFLAIVSHELRSPLNGIQSWALVLEAALADAPPAVGRALSGIKVGVAQQVRLIDDLLDATRIITGELSLSITPVALAPVIRAAIESTRIKAAERGIEVLVALDLGEATVDGDSDRLQQVMWNLLSNAIKFTPHGGHVWIDARCAGGQAVIVVRDDGRGIDPAFMPLLFERFQRDETGNSRGQDGFGLGLMLVRHLCRLHRGDVVGVSAGRGLGACFTVRLPLSGAEPLPPPVRAAAARPAGDLGDLRLLLVDDHIESRDALAVLLVRAGAAVSRLDSGEEAVRRFAHAPPDARYDLLVCDIAMPGQDGYETLRRIRVLEQERGLPALPAIALTAFGSPEHRQRSREAGFAAHVVKPVDFVELVAAIAALARAR